MHIHPAHTMQKGTIAGLVRLLNVLFLLSPRNIIFTSINSIHFDPNKTSYKYIPFTDIWTTAGHYETCTQPIYQTQCPHPASFSHQNGWNVNKCISLHTLVIVVVVLFTSTSIILLYLCVCRLNLCLFWV